MQLLFIFLLTCGCTSKYTITFNDDSIDEEFISTIPDSDIPTLSDDDIKLGIDLDDDITPFIKGDQYPFFGNEDIKYNKTVEKVGNNNIVTLKYSYKYDEFNNSQAINKCFGKAAFNEEENQYSFTASGKFYCLYSDEVEINFVTDKKVLKHNATKVEGNKYTWILNEDNYKNVDISIQISNGVEEAKKKRANVILLVIGLIILSATFFFYLKFKNGQKANQI